MGRSRRLRRLAVVPVLLAAGAVACEPGGGPNATSVAYTTDQVATAEIGRHDVRVRWLTCTADQDAADRDTLVAVDCQGETDDGRDLAVSGRITRAVDGHCVRGDLSADVGDKEIFRVGGLGDCGSATPSPVTAPTSAPDGGAPTATVTVTVTVTENARK